MCELIGIAAIMFVAFLIIAGTVGGFIIYKIHKDKIARKERGII